MEILELQEQGPQILEVTEETAPTPTPEIARTQAEYYSYVLTRPVEELEQDILNGFQEKIRADANHQSVMAGEDTVSKRIYTAAERGEDPTVVLNEVRQMRFGDYAAPQVSVLLENSDLGARERRQVDRIVAANDIINEFQSKEQGGVLATVGEFGDIAVSDLVHNVVGGVSGLFGLGEDTFENASNRVELAKEANALLMSDLPEFEFRAQFSSLIQRVADAGFFTSSNSFYLEEFISMIEEAGQGKISQGATAFQILDVATAGLGTAIVRGVGRASGQAATLSKIRGREAAAQVAVKAADTGKPSAVVAEVQPRLTHAANPNGGAWLSAPQDDALRLIEAEHTTLQDIMRNGPKFTDENELKAAHAAAKQKMREQIKQFERNEVDINIVHAGFRNVVGQVLLGKTDRTMFTTKGSAQALANKVGGYVVPVVEGGKTKFGVVWETNISTEGIGVATDLGEIAKGLTTKFTSTARNTTKYLQGVKIQGEAANAKVIRDASKAWMKAASKVSKQEVDNVDSIFKTLLNDPNEAVEGTLTRAEFTKRYHEAFEEMPRQEVLDYWETVQRMADADYFLEADRILYEAVANNETMVKAVDGNFYRAKRIDVPAGTKIWDEDAKDFVFVNKDTAGFQIKDAAYNVEGKGYISTMVVKNPVTRRLYHSDVLHYNAGGHRVYKQDMNWFLKQDTSITLADGSNRTGAPRTFMGVRLEKEADQTISEFNTIVDNLDNPNINEIIQKNNNWNKNIETKEDFLAFADKHGLDPTSKITKAADGEATYSSGGKAEAWAGENTIGSRFAGTASRAAKGRGQRPLIGFGGDELAIMNPARALQMRYARTLNQKADAAYVNRAAQGLFKAIDQLEKQGKNPVKNWKDIKELTAADKIRQMEFKSGEIGDTLRTEQETILRAMSVKNQDQMTIERTLQSVADVVYGKNLPWMNKKVKGVSAQDATDWLASVDYPGFLRSVAFHTKLGLLSVDQLIVQSSQIVNASLITMANVGPTEVVRTLAGAPWVLRAMASNNEDVIKRMALAQSRVTGISPEDFIQLRQWLHDTGRLVVDRTAVEENRDAVIGAGVKARLSNVSTKMFTLGEQNARIYAALFNLKELRAGGYKGALSGDDITRKMMQRQDVLTASMTAASAASWQKGFLSIPLQFMTYNRNIMEQVFTKDILTGKERAWLGLGHLFVYGAAAVPFVGAAMDRYGSEIIPPDTRLYHAMRYGALDQGLSLLTEGLGGRETALSSRLGIGDGFTTLAQDIGGDASFTELVFGPGGSILYDSLAAFGYLAGSVAKGEPLDVQGYELNRFLRIASSWDDASKLYAATVYGEYWTRRSGVVTMNGLNVVDGMIQALGIPLADEKKLWAEIGRGQVQRRVNEKVFKEIEERSRLATRLLESGNNKGAYEVIDDMMFLMAALPASERDEAMRRMMRNQDLPDTVIKNLIRDGKLDMAERMRKDME